MAYDGRMDDNGEIYEKMWTWVHHQENVERSLFNFWGRFLNSNTKFG